MQNAPDPKAKDTKAKKGAAVEPESEAQKTANAASALLAEQAAQQCAEHLAAGETANRQAHARAEEAAAAAQSATDAAMEVLSTSSPHNPHLHRFLCHAALPCTSVPEA